MPLTNSQTGVLFYVPRGNGRKWQVWHAPEAGANVPRGLADGRMDVEGHLGQLLLLLLLLHGRLACTARPSTVHDALCRSLPARRCQYRLFIPL